MSTPSQLLLAFYGDDFTGSTDAMEALALSGLRTVLFLAPPTPDLLKTKFPDLRCVGVAGTSRAMSPAEMDVELKPILREFGQSAHRCCTIRCARRSIHRRPLAASAM